MLGHDECASRSQSRAGGPGGWAGAAGPARASCEACITSVASVSMEEPRWEEHSTMSGWKREKNAESLLLTVTFQSQTKVCSARREAEWTLWGLWVNSNDDYFDAKVHAALATHKSKDSFDTLSWVLCANFTTKNHCLWVNSISNWRALFMKCLKIHWKGKSFKITANYQRSTRHWKRMRTRRNIQAIEGHWNEIKRKKNVPWWKFTAINRLAVPKSKVQDQRFKRWSLMTVWFRDGI